jgi:hypothetical protein
VNNCPLGYRRSVMAHGNPHPQIAPDCHVKGAGRSTPDVVEEAQGVCCRRIPPVHSGRGDEPWGRRGRTNDVRRRLAQKDGCERIRL